MNHMYGWREPFLQTDGCTICTGWKLCGGRFHDQRQDGNGCDSFFAEWMDTLEQYQDNQQKYVWNQSVKCSVLVSEIRELR